MHCAAVAARGRIRRSVIVEDLRVQVGIALARTVFAARSARGLDAVLALRRSARLHEQRAAQPVRERVLDAKSRHQLMLEVDHKRMGAATGSGLERPLVPVLDLVERDEQRQRDLGPSRRWPDLDRF